MLKLVLSDGGFLMEELRNYRVFAIFQALLSLDVGPPWPDPTREK